MMKALKSKSILVLATMFVVAICSALLFFQPLTVQASVDINPTGNVYISNSAQVRVVENLESGLRYQAFINKNWYNSLENAQAGAIIVPNSYVETAIEENGSFSLNNLMDVVSKYDLPFQAVDTADLKDYNKDYYSYALTMIKIKETNFARDFVGIAYVRTSSTVDGAESINNKAGLANGNYVVAYDETNVRSVYQMAYNVLTSTELEEPLDEDQTAVLKSYVDGVAVVSKTNDGVAIANNDKEGYTSPYAVYGADNEFIVTSANMNAKSIVYNGERQTSYPIVDGNTTIHLTKISGVENIDANGNITLNGPDTLANPNNGTIRLIDNSYFALNEKYSVGTYVEFEFTGNNMPQLCFFADEINGYMAYSSPTTTECVNDGLLVLNGISATTSGWNNAIKAYGAHRYGYGSDLSTYIVNKTATGMSQSELVSDKTYRLVIGTHVVSDKVYLEMFLFDKATNTKISSFDQSTGKAPTYFDESGNPSGYIIAYAGLKGGEDTTFKFNGVGLESDFDTVGTVSTTITLSGANPNNRNSATFNGATLSQLTGHQTLLDNDNKPANYGLNTYLDISFTGNNMPIMTFFAKEDSGAIANGWSTDETGAGIIMFNGLVNKGTTGLTDRFRILGPYKFGAKDSSGTKIYNQDNFGSYSVTSNDNGYSNLKALAQDNLVADNNYRLVIGAIEKQDGYIYFDIQFKNLTTSEVLINAEFKTKVTVEAMKEALGITTGDLTGYIILNGAYKGGDATTFTINAVKDSKIVIDN